MVLYILMKGENLPEKCKDHQLKGEMKFFSECHIEPDWLLICGKEDEELIFYATAQAHIQICFICNLNI